MFIKILAKNFILSAEGNSAAVFVVMILIALSWDYHIAKFNLRILIRANRYSYLFTLSDEALPVLNEKKNL
jgi:hypothetical protein